MYMNKAIFTYTLCMHNNDYYRLNVHVRVLLTKATYNVHFHYMYIVLMVHVCIYSTCALCIYTMYMYIADSVHACIYVCILYT